MSEKNFTMKKWTKKSAIARMHNNPLLQQVLQVEPRIRPILEEAEQQKRGGGYHRIRKYIELKRKASRLVGWDSQNKELRTQEFYSAVISTIDDLLPPGDVDLIPSGAHPIKSDNRYKIGKLSNCEAHQSY